MREHWNDPFTAYQTQAIQRREELLQQANQDPDIQKHRKEWEGTPFSEAQKDEKALYQYIRDRNILLPLTENGSLEEGEMFLGPVGSITFEGVRNCLGVLLTDENNGIELGAHILAFYSDEEEEVQEAAQSLADQMREFFPGIPTKITFHSPWLGQPQLHGFFAGALQAHYPHVLKIVVETSAKER